MKKAGLIIFCWGDQNTDPANLKLLKQWGLHGVIFDKIYQLSSKEVKESIFLVEARESQKDLIRLAAASAEIVVPPVQEPVMKAAPSVDSLESSVSTS